MNIKIKAKNLFEKEMGPMTFGAFLATARLSLDMTQTELAQRLKVSRSMMCDIEKGRVNASVALAVKIAKLAGFPAQFAVKYCLQDQLRRAKIKMQVDVSTARAA